MRDYSKFPAPREVHMGRRLMYDERRRTNQGLLYALIGLAVLCICAGLGLLAFTVPAFNGHPLIEIGGAAAPAASARATERPAAKATEPPASQGTPVPLGRSIRSDAGLKVTVTTYQRPLPAEGIRIPEGQELALVSLIVENTKTSGAPLRVRPADFQLLSPENEIFNPTVSGITTGSMLAATELEAGKIVEGDLVFYVYSDVRDLTLVWKTSEGNRVFSLQRAR